MLDINMEFRKGILFVRLHGILSQETCDKLDNFLGPMIKKKKVRYIVFNLEEVEAIDFGGIMKLLKYNSNLVKNNGKALICGVKNTLVKLEVKNSKMLNYMYETSDELSAINSINI